MTREEKIRAIFSRDSACDGRFIFGVRTTRVLCCPGCPARLPLEKNIVFFDSLEEGLRAGYRPCKRCHPERYGP